jgi:pyridoxamine 5'-phosphate oxidase
MDISDIRREYRYAGLAREDLHQDPVVQFERWFRDAHDNDLNTPNALSLATVDAGGMPSVRTVLLKTFDHDGFVFYTNYSSRKAKDLKQNPQAAMLFHWLEFDRQVKIQGNIAKVSAAESLGYFISRPRGSQLAAWCSEQSAPVESRDALMQAFNAMQNKFTEGEIPLPDFWGGYRLKPQRIEFWQGRENRLHDRFDYLRDSDDGWTIQRLAP